MGIDAEAVPRKLSWLEEQPGISWNGMLSIVLVEGICNSFIGGIYPTLVVTKVAILGTASFSQVAIAVVTVKP